MGTWTVEFVSTQAREEFDALPLDVRASLGRVASLIEEYGLPAMSMPYVRHLEGKLWEMRGRGRDGIARSVYVAVQGRKVMILRSFVKKTQKTPAGELAIALKRAKEKGYVS